MSEQDKGKPEIYEVPYKLHGADAARFAERLIRIHEAVGEDTTRLKQAIEIASWELKTMNNQDQRVTGKCACGATVYQEAVFVAGEFSHKQLMDKCFDCDMEAQTHE